MSISIDFFMFFHYQQKTKCRTCAVPALACDMVPVYSDWRSSTVSYLSLLAGVVEEKHH